MTDSKRGYRPDNVDSPPEGSYSLVQKKLNCANTGSIKQTVRACVDESGAKGAGANSDETDVANNSVGFIVSGEVSGSLHETLQGKNIKRNQETRRENNRHSTVEEEMITEQSIEQAENIEENIIAQSEVKEWCNEHLFPFSTIPKP